MNYGALFPFLSFFAVIILIGILASRFSSRGLSEFFIGGRRMNMIVVALSAVVSGRSAWLLLGFTGQSYSMGLSAIWAVVGYIVVEFFLFLYYAPRIRKFAGDHDCITLPDFFTSRFNDEKGSLRILITVIFIIFMVSYISAQFVGGGKAFYAYFDTEPATGLILTAVIVLVYTIMGGFLAVSLTDVFQAIVMLIALIGLPIVGIIHKGGFTNIVTALNELDPQFFNARAFGMGTLFGFLGIGLGSPGNPHILVRYMSIKDPQQLKLTAVIGTVWNILMAAGAFFIGIIARSYYPSTLYLPGKDPENAFIQLAQQLLPDPLVGLILAAVFAAIMSTADSQLLVAASAVVRDIYEKVIHKDKYIPPEKLTLISRIVVAALVYLAIILGFIVEDLVFWFVLFAWAGLGAAIGPTSFLALFWKRTTKTGVMAGMITGTLTVFVWKSIPRLNEMIYELIPAFFAGLFVTFIVSLAENLLRKK